MILTLHGFGAEQVSRCPKLAASRSPGSRLWAQWGPALFSLPASPPPIIPVSPTLQGSCKQQLSRGFLEPGKLHEWRLIVYYFFLYSAEGSEVFHACSKICLSLTWIFVFRLCMMDFWLCHWSFKEAIYLASGLGILSDLPQVTQLRLDSSLMGKAKVITITSYFSEPLPGSLPFTWWAWGYQSGPGSGLSTLRKEILTSAFFFFFFFGKQICINHFEHTFSNHNFDLWMPVAVFLQQPLWFALMWRYRVSCVSPSCPACPAWGPFFLCCGFVFFLFTFTSLLACSLSCSWSSCCNGLWSYFDVPLVVEINSPSHPHAQLVSS